jgi:hypothetical protein
MITKYVKMLAMTFCIALGATFDELKLGWKNWVFFKNQELDLNFFVGVKKGSRPAKPKDTKGGFTVIAEKTDGKFVKVTFNEKENRISIEDIDHTYETQIGSTNIRLHIPDLRAKIDAYITNGASQFEARDKFYTLYTQNDKLFILETPVDPDADGRHDYKWVKIEAENTPEAFVRLMRESNTKPLSNIEQGPIFLAYHINKPENVFMLRATRQENADYVFFVKKVAGDFRNESMQSSKEEVDKAFEHQSLFDKDNKLGTFASEGSNYTVYVEDGQRKIVEAPDSILFHVTKVDLSKKEAVLREMIEIAKLPKVTEQHLEAMQPETYVAVNAKGELLLIKKETKAAFAIDMNGHVIEKKACVDGFDKIKHSAVELQKLLEERNQIIRLSSKQHIDPLLIKIASSSGKIIVDEELEANTRKINQLLAFTNPQL